jgi:Flp pilus assembly protein TadG
LKTVRFAHLCRSNDIIGLLQRFVRDVRGAYTVEFALCAVPFFGLICAFCETSYVYYETDSLQAAVSAAGRKVLTGNAQTGTATTAAAFTTQYLCPILQPAGFNCNNLIVDVRGAADFTSADTNNDFYLTTPKYCLGLPGSIVVLRVAYPLPAILPLSIFGSIGVVSNVPNVPGEYHLLFAADTFKTEPYQGTYTPPATC